jgi:hypothetical protein
MKKITLLLLSLLSLWSCEDELFNPPKTEYEALLSGEWIQTEDGYVSDGKEIMRSIPRRRCTGV